MQQLSKGPQDTLVLSRGKTLQAQFRSRTPFPTGAEGIIEVFDLAGGLLATFYADAVDRTMTFEEDAAAHSDIPAGSVFEFSITDPDLSDPIPVSHGEVVRQEAGFPFAAPTIVDDPARQFSDNFSAIVSRRWIRIAGNTSLAIHDNGSDPNSMGPNYGWTNQAAALWYSPMSMDSVTIVVKLVQVNPFITVGYGQLNVVVCSDSSMKNFLALQFQAGNTNGGNRVLAVTGNGNGPFSWDNQGTPVAHTVNTADVYSIKFSYLDNKLSLYAGSDLDSLSGIFSWTDSTNIVQHGSEAFRYTGLAFNSSVFAPSVEPTDWEARDGI